MCGSGQVMGASGLSESTLPRARRATMWGRYLKLGANTRATASLPYSLRCAQNVRSLSPALWKRVRFKCGLGTRAAKRAMAAPAHPAPAAYRTSCT